jgi:heme exporter protein D
MNWPTDWQSFWAMNGYGLYVWGSFGVCFALLAAEVLLLRRRHRQAPQALGASDAAPLIGAQTMQAAPARPATQGG